MLKKQDLEWLDTLEARDLHEYIMEHGMDSVVQDDTKMSMLKQDVNRVYGCQSLVWVSRENSEWLWESNAIFVQGLLNIIMSHIVEMSDEDILNINFNDKFAFICPSNLTTGRITGVRSFMNKVLSIVRN
jgi:sulfur transfer protein SufE